MVPARRGAAVFSRTPAMAFPNIPTLSRLLLAFLLAVTTSVALAQERARRLPGATSQAEQQASEPRSGILRLLPADAVSEHTVDVPGGKLAYTATAGTFSLYDRSGEHSAAIFYTAYVAKGAEPTGRPVTFVFNGGPGAASAFLNLGRGRSAHRRVRSKRPRRRRRSPPGQSGYLARLHRSGADRSGWRRLEPARQTGRRQCVLGG